jgi:anti-sigma B factor antagonist
MGGDERRAFVTTTPSARVEVSQEAGTLILRLCGELDTASRDVIEGAVLAAIPTAHAVILDLGDLTFCDSNGVAMFLAAHRKAEAEGTVLTLGNLPSSVLHVFEASGIHDVLKITE